MHSLVYEFPIDEREREDIIVEAGQGDASGALSTTRKTRRLYVLRLEWHLTCEASGLSQVRTRFRGFRHRKVYLIHW